MKQADLPRGGWGGGPGVTHQDLALSSRRDRRKALLQVSDVDVKQTIFETISVSNSSSRPSESVVSLAKSSSSSVAAWTSLGTP